MHPLPDPDTPNLKTARISVAVRRVATARAVPNTQTHQPVAGRAACYRTRLAFYHNQHTASLNQP